MFKNFLERISSFFNKKENNNASISAGSGAGDCDRYSNCDSCGGCGGCGGGE